MNLTVLKGLDGMIVNYYFSCINIKNYLLKLINNLDALFFILLFIILVNSIIIKKLTTICIHYCR